MQAEDVIKKIAELCQKYSADQGILFGSRAKGTALERSDIDIAVSGVAQFSALQEDIRKYGKSIYEKVSVL